MLGEFGCPEISNSFENFVAKFCFKELGRFSAVFHRKFHYHQSKRESSKMIEKRTKQVTQSSPRHLGLWIKVIIYDTLLLILKVTSAFILKKGGGQFGGNFPGIIVNSRDILIKGSLGDLKKLKLAAAAVSQN